MTESSTMTNQQINDLIKDAYTVFRKYRDRRPVTDEKELDDILDAFDGLTSKYAVYDANNDALNAWIFDFMYKGLVRELMSKNE